MRSPQQDLDRALQHHQAGEFAQAEAVCLLIVRDDPSHADAWNLLGVLASQAGKAETALECLHHAQRAAPAHGAYRSNRGVVLRGLGRLAEAEMEYREALCLDPTHAETHNNLGNLLRDLGKLDEAAECCRRALSLQPNYPEAHNNLGNVLRDLKRYEESRVCYQQALALRPTYAEAQYNLGAVLRDLERLEESEACYRRALELKPNYADALTNRGIVLQDLNRLKEAAACCRSVVALQPNAPEPHNNLGTVLQDMGELAQAEDCYRRALALRPAYTWAHYNLARLLLATGEYPRGWPEYEWRWQLKQIELPAHPQPLWDGSSLAGRTVLLHAEQGLGDTIQFVRYAAFIKQHDATVFLHCPRRLLSLLRSCSGIDRLIPMDTAPPPFDVYAPLLSLPRLFATTVDAIPAPIPYLSANPRSMERWRSRIRSVPGFKVGIVWQGNRRQGNARYRALDRKRSVQLTQFEPLAHVPGVSLFSLQVGPGQEQLTAPIHRFAVTDLGSQFDPESFDDAAAAVKCLDLVVTVDTATAHLAGALGVPVWVVLPFAPDWRWLLEREDSPWYPTMRLFRQRRPGDWDEVFERVAHELAARCGEPGRVSAGSTSRR